MTIEELQKQIDDLNDRVQSLGERFGKELNDGFNNSPPIGSIIFMASTEPPSDQYLLCDGRALSRTEFRELFSVISTTWGEGDGTTTFNIPDLRGAFPRFLNASNEGADSNRQLGELQEESTKLPNSAFTMDQLGGHVHTLAANGNHNHSIGNAGSHRHSVDPAGRHNHGNGQFDRLVRLTGGDTERSVDSTPTEFDNLASQPLVAADNHTHPLAANGVHSHGASTTGQHGHTVGTNGIHRHTISGGDSETRPINYALVGFIRI